MLSLIFVPVSLKIINEIIIQTKAGQLAALLGLILPLAAVSSTIIFIYTFLRNLNFRSSTLTVVGGHGVLGGQLKGHIINNCDPAKGFDVTAVCSSRW